MIRFLVLFNINVHTVASEKTKDFLKLKTVATNTNQTAGSYTPASVLPRFGCCYMVGPQMVGSYRALLGPYGPVWARPGPTHHTKPFQKLTLFLKKRPLYEPTMYQPTICQHPTLAMAASSSATAFVSSEISSVNFAIEASS